MACAALYFYRSGMTLWYGDAESHLNIARRIVDSRTPGISQLGTTWLPLPHLAMIPFVSHDDLWKTGLAGAIPSALAMALAGVFLFAAVRRIFSSAIGATAATAVFLLNPNTLYLGSIPMSEPYFYAALFALLYFTARFGDTKGWGALLGAALAGPRDAGFGAVFGGVTGAAIGAASDANAQAQASAEQATATEVTLAVTLEADPFDTVQFCPVGWVLTVTA